ncbi:MAG: prepilin-type N-terminal cleavage/methylation domain-containing protein [Candidatus Omnitrophica bacterium]|nr:prepilin-type N-terminal cleavage/methylation domain-containing protein [Candidatus Omnitrophota bacterium]
MNQADKRDRGFTLIEILLVVVIMAVIAALAVSNFSRTYAGIELRKAADDLAYRMRYAQSYAVTKNTRARLEFDPLFTQYWLTRPAGSSRSQRLPPLGEPLAAGREPPGLRPKAPRGEEQSGDDAAQDAFERITGRFGQSTSLPRDVRLSFEDGDPSLFFYPDGTIDKRRISLCRGEDCVFISTQKQRGQVSVLNN